MPIQRIKKADNIEIESRTDPKRNLVSVQTAVSAKRTKAETTPWEKLTGVNDVVNLILSHLSARDLINFEQAAKAHAQLTRHAWQRLPLAMRDCLQWQTCENLPDEYKWNYALSAAVAEFLRITADSTSGSKEKMDRFSEKFGALQSKFRCFKIFMELGQVFDKPEDDIDLSVYYPEDFKRIGELSLETNTWSGETLLDVLRKTHLFYHSPSGKKTQAKKKAHTAFVRAINKGATCASLLALRVGAFKSFHLSLALLAAAAKDYRALTKLVRTMKTKELIHLKDLGQCFGPILATLATCTKDLNEQDSLISQAIAEYGAQSTQGLIVKAASIKEDLSQWIEADALFDQALAKEGDTAGSDLLIKAARSKERLGKLEEANSLLNRALEWYGDQAPLEVLSDVARLKVLLQGRKPQA